MIITRTPLLLTLITLLAPLVAAVGADSKPVFLYSRHYNAKGENRYEPDGNFKDILSRLRGEFDLRVNDKPITREALKDVRVLLIANPSDNAVSNNPAPPHISSEDIVILTEYVRQGGGLIISGNQEDHNLELTQVNRLLTRFGMQFTNVYTDFKPIPLPPNTPIIGGLRWAFYSGNQLLVKDTPSARTKILVTNNVTMPIKGTRNPHGILMATSEAGKGRVLAVTDTGWLNDTALSGEGIAGASIRDQDNWEIFRRLAKWVARAD